MKSKNNLKNNFDFYNEINNVFRILLTNEVFTYKLVNTNPNLGLKIIKSSLDENLLIDFVEYYLKNMIMNPKSILSREIKNNQNKPHGIYEIKKENEILYTLLYNISLADKLNIWKPIGEGIIEYLQSQQKNETDIENKMNEYQDFRWESPVFNGIRFFDIMITQALVNNTKYHMWLFYFTDFTKNILENMEFNIFSDLEFSNMYEYYLYEIFNCYINWIKFCTYNEYNVRLKNTDCKHQNENIIKSSIIALSQSFEYIIEKSDKIRLSLKKQIQKMILDLHDKLKILNKNDFNCKRMEIINQYRITLLNCLKKTTKNITSKDKAFIQFKKIIERL